MFHPLLKVWQTNPPPPNSLFRAAEFLNRFHIEKSWVVSFYGLIHTFRCIYHSLRRLSTFLYETFKFRFDSFLKP